MGDTFAPLPGAPMFFKAPTTGPAEAEPLARPMSTEYGFARRMEELFQPLGPKRAKHTFSQEELAAIDSRPPESFLAKPPRVKAWNLKKARLLNIPNLKIELKQETQQGGGNDTQQRWSQECVTVSFCVAADNKKDTNDNKRDNSDNNKTISQVLSMELTSNQIKNHMFELAGIQAKVEDYDLRIPAINHVVSLDNLALRRQTFIQACLLSRISPLFEVVPKSTTNSSDDDNLKKHIQTELEIFELVGLPLARTLDLYKPEVIASRRALAALRLGVTRNHHTSSDAELQQFVYVESEPLPLTIPSNVSVVAQLPINAIRITVSVDPTKEVDEARNKIFRKFSIIDKANSQGKSANDYVLKATGFREYLVPSLNLANNNRHQLSSSNKNERFKLIDYDFIRKRISKNQQIELTLVDVADLREQIAEAEGESIIDHLLCAEFESEQAQAQQVTNGKIETNFEDSYDPPFPSLLNTRPIPATKMHRSFRIKACCVRDTRTAREDVFTKFKEKEKGDPSIYVRMELFHGGQSLAPAILTPLAPAPVSEKDAPLVYPQWDEWREFPIKISDLPKATVVSFTIYAGDSDLGWTASSDIKGVPLGWGNIQLVDYDGCIRMGLFARKLWEDGVANPIGTCMDNVKKGAATLLVEFETFIRPLVYSDSLIPTPAASIAASSPPINTNSPGSSPPTSPVQTHRNMYDIASIRKSSYNLSSSQLGLTPFRKIETAEARQLQSILQYDPLTPLTPSDKKMMWNFRNLTRPKYRALPKFLQSVSWGDSEQVAETHRLLEVWAVPPPVLALQLLDAKFPDETVRNYAVTILNSLTDAEVSDFLPQLVQVLKYELHHDSPLARLLIERALRNRSRIGHSFFWFLRAEMHVSEIEERYGILLEGYLRSCGRHRTELLKQHQVLKDLYSVAMAVKNAAPTDRKKALMDGLSQVKFPERFQLPLDPRWEVKGLIQDKCRFMDSKKLPLWLTFENVEPNAPPINVIFKVGDDIRQDILTLQMIRIMDKMWKNASMDLRLNPYGTVSMGDSIGMIEVVLNSKTIASINKDAGGTGAVLADKSLDNWLRKHNPSDALYSQAVKTFILSCAGYVVATYVLGIGDRHADNIMMCRSGHLFHIDFGHFLGNFKSKFGFKRERAPFIFTAQYLAIVGGKDSENFKYFVDVCCKAYNIIRKQSDLFMNLFQLMVSTGIPELQSIDDINYLRKTLAPELSDDDAASEFSKNILVALNTKTVIINDIIHGWVH